MSGLVSFYEKLPSFSQHCYLQTASNESEFESCVTICAE